jgi:drug/metabolite transporter (DMT)-like permease
MKENHLSRRGAELLLAGVIIARATSYLFSKLILEGMGMFNLLGVRFTLAFTLLALLFFPRLKSMSRKTFVAGVMMGGMYFLVVAAELSGLKRMSSGNASFLVNTAIVLVPLLQAILRRRFPEGKVILSVLLCMLGVGILTLGSRMGFGSGERWCLLAAFLYACTILLTDRLSHSGIDTLTAGVVQVGIIGALSLTASFLTETPRLPSGSTEWLGIVMLAAVCSCFGFTLQPVAQSGTTAERAGMFCALNPIVSAALGVIFLNETFTVKTVIGGILILLGILLAEMPQRREKRCRPYHRCAVNKL